MKKITSLFLSLALVLSLTLFSACGKTEKAHHADHSQFVKNEELSFLYEVTYYDYDWNDVTEYLEGSAANNASGEAMGCSAVHSGNFFGRSFDYFLLDKPGILLRTEHKDGRFASIGIAGGNFSFDGQKLESINAGNGTADDLLNEKLLPFAMIDGMNENGVICCGNVVPAHDFAAHEGEEEYYTHGTNPGKEDLYYQFVIRYVLDNAKSAEHAVELLRNRNITALNSKGEMRDYQGVGTLGYELHYMIADKDNTYIVELVNDRMSVIAGDIMTNFYLSYMTPSGVGHERYRILYDNYQDVHSVSDMKTLIEQVRYSNAYRIDLENQDSAYWPTEMSSQKRPYYETEKWSRENWETVKAKFGSYNEIVKNEIRSPKGGDGIPWISFHAEVYDIENRTLNLCTQENYDNWVEFKIN